MNPLALGASLVELLDRCRFDGARRLVALIRHSAREFAPGRHDLENPLTDEGRQAARALGALLPEGLALRGYASPAERCIETSKLILDGYRAAGGTASRTRPVEGLGVFYVLDQMKMYRAMNEAGGLRPFCDAWFAGRVGPDILLPAAMAAAALAAQMHRKLDEHGDALRLDVLVTHDLTLHLVRDRLLGIADPDVAFLDGVVLYEVDGRRYLASPGRAPVVSV